MWAWVFISGLLSAGMGGAAPETGGLQATAVGTEVIQGSLPQPAQIPGIAADEPRLPTLPPLAPILARAKHQPLIYGLYTWKGEYALHRKAIRNIGWRFFRMGGPVDDEITRMFSEDEARVVVGPKQLGQKPDADPAGDAGYIQGGVDGVRSFWSRYGTHGEFFRENPGLSHRPFVAMESKNEPNFHYMIKPDKRRMSEQEADRVALYAKLQPELYGAFKAIEANLPFVGFSAGGAGAGDLRFIAAAHKATPDVARSYDILGTHPYVDPTPPEAYAVRSWGRYSLASSLAKIRGTMAEYGKLDTPVWYTEIGWQISKDDGGRYAVKGGVVSPELQAAYVCRLYAYAQRLGVGRVTNMFITDTDGFNGGFFAPDKTWRPSAKAVQTMIRLMPEPRLVAALSDGEAGDFAYVFAPHAKAGAVPVLMVWNVFGPKVVAITVAAAARVRVVDMLGVERAAVTMGGAVRVEAGPLPLYLVGDSAGWMPSP